MSEANFPLERNFVTATIRQLASDGHCIATANNDRFARLQVYGVPLNGVGFANTDQITAYVRPGTGKQIVLRRHGNHRNDKASSYITSYISRASSDQPTVIRSRDAMLYGNIDILLGGDAVRIPELSDIRTAFEHHFSQFLYVYSLSGSYAGHAADVALKDVTSSEGLFTRDSSLTNILEWYLPKFGGIEKDPLLVLCDKSIGPDEVSSAIRSAEKIPLRIRRKDKPDYL